MPRPEIDLVAYKAGTNELLPLECKSYFDSGGVHTRDLLPGGKNAQHYKMFVNDALRTIVLQRLVEQLTASGTILPSSAVKLGMVYGHASEGNDGALKAHFTKCGWLAFGPSWIKDHLHRMGARWRPSTEAV
jgi:hypothetical protein